MDHPSGNTTPTLINRPSLTGHLSSTGYARGGDHSGVSSEISLGNTLRRGHSDGEVLGNGLFTGRSKAPGAKSTLQKASWMTSALTSALGDPSNSNPTLNGKSRFEAANSSGHGESSSMQRVPSTTHISHPIVRLGQGHMPGHATPVKPYPLLNNGASSRPAVQRLPTRPDIEAARDRRSREIALPPWQSDAEVSQCPICGTAFSFWYRKHHCRKCGRVVCANCSPHRITIPRQFIVHPPEDAPRSPTTNNAQGIEVVDLTGDDEEENDSLYQRDRPQSSDYRIDPGLGGGQEVRLCNPCVPDPNPLPHVPYPSPVRNTHATPQIPTRSSFSQSRAPSIRPSAPDQLPSSHNRQIPLPRSDDSYGDVSRLIGRRTSAPIPPFPNPSPSRYPHPMPRLTGPSLPARDHPSIYGSAPNNIAPHVSSTIALKHARTDQNQRGLTALLQEQGPHHRHRQHASFGGFSDRARLHHLPPSTAQAAPRPQLREEDECPICHQALPAKGPNGSETAREAHVQSCIESHFSSSGPPPAQVPSTVAASASSAGSSSTPGRSSTAMIIPSTHRASVSSNDIPSASLQMRRRVAGMLVYNASEKDCVGADGEGGQECIICFEDFAVGDEMGRLECLCKFHKVCWIEGSYWGVYEY